MKRIKTIIGIVLIIAALGAMYMWNAAGREKAEALKQEQVELAESIIEPKKTKAEIAFDKNCSLFPLSTEWIFAKSNLLNVGDIVGVYFRDTKEKLGSFEVAYISEDYVDIMCKLKDFYKIDDYLKELESEDKAQLILVMEKNNG